MAQANARSVSRRSALAVAAAAPAAIAMASPGEPEWPEFREWYALMLEEERLYMLPNSPDTDDPASGHPAINARMRALEAAMSERRPTSSTDRAAAAVLALYWADKGGDASSPHRQRLLRLGCFAGECGAEVWAARLIEAQINEVVHNCALPGVVIWNADGVIT